MSRQGQAHGDPANVDTRTVPKSVGTDENVADLMTKHLAEARVEEPLSKLGCATVCEGACGRTLNYESRGQPLSRAHRPRVDEVMLLVVGRVVLVLALVELAGALAVGVGVVVTPPLEECQGSLLEHEGVQRESQRDPIGVFSQTQNSKPQTGNPCWKTRLTPLSLRPPLRMGQQSSIWPVCLWLFCHVFMKFSSKNCMLSQYAFFNQHVSIRFVNITERTWQDINS